VADYFAVVEDFEDFGIIIFELTQLQLRWTDLKLGK